MKSMKKTQIASIGFSEIMETPDERSQDTFDFEQLQFIRGPDKPLPIRLMMMMMMAMMMMMVVMMMVINDY